MPTRGEKLFASCVRSGCMSTDESDIMITHDEIRAPNLVNYILSKGRIGLKEFTPKEAAEGQPDEDPFISTFVVPSAKLPVLHFSI
ncbi:hypothetical protein MUK42_22164 [Musa troglodytarum]|uniref:Uncharacterized protein n=1 Tax=Musa troglodytarum TaxID=320322 RepID=A0A9E7FEZ5_9LILI|nr:hypothetical protein MUK42_22164 [Musa troglodytarum]